MPYLTYDRDMRRAWAKLGKPSRSFVNSAFKIHDPFKLFPQGMRFVTHGFFFLGKAFFFSMRKVFNI